MQSCCKRSKVIRVPYHIVVGEHVRNCQMAARSQRSLLKSTKCLMKRGVRQIRGSDRFGRPILGTSTVRTMQRVAIRQDAMPQFTCLLRFQHFQGDQGEVLSSQSATIQGSMLQILCEAEVACRDRGLDLSLHAFYATAQKAYNSFVVRTKLSLGRTRPANPPVLNTDSDRGAAFRFKQGLAQIVRDLHNRELAVQLKRLLVQRQFGLSCLYVWTDQYSIFRILLQGGLKSPCQNALVHVHASTRCYKVSSTAATVDLFH